MSNLGKEIEQVVAKQKVAKLQMKGNGRPGQERCGNLLCEWVVDELGLCTNGACDWDYDHKLAKEIVPPCPAKGCAAVMVPVRDPEDKMLSAIGWLCAECNQEYEVGTLEPPTEPLIQREMVNHPDHYGGDTPYEDIKVLWSKLTREQFDGWIRGTVSRYTFRAGKKDPTKLIEDLRKGAWYLAWYTDALENKHPFQQEKHA